MESPKEINFNEMLPIFRIIKSNENKLNPKISRILH